MSKTDLLKRIIQRPFWIIYVLSLGVLGILLFLYTIGPSHKTATNTSVDLLSGQDWSHLSGVTVDASGVHIQPLGRAIVNQDGSGGQPNPPVNVRGPHLSVRGDFRISLKAKIAPNSSAIFCLYGAVPIIYDEWRYQTPQVRIDVGEHNMNVSLWDGSKDQPVEQISWPGTFDPSVNLAITNQKGNLTFSNNGQKIGSLSGHSIFSEGSVWFGSDAPVNSPGWRLINLLATPLGDGQLKVISGTSLKIDITSSYGLRILADNQYRHLPIGAAVANYALFSDEGYRQLVASQFSMLTPENELKAQFIHPQPDTYSFTEADSLVDFAKANNMKVHGHNLVFSEANPRWMQDAPLARRQQIMFDHISTVMHHFGNRISEWDVVDEPLSDSDNDFQNSNDLRQNIWLAAMGENYIGTAFRTARAANPNAKLYINEYGLEADGPRWDEFLALIKRLQGSGVPLDGVGFQAHVHDSADKIDSQVLMGHMQQLARLGLVSRISEMDVYGDSQDQQAKQYAAVLKACLDVPSCTSFNTWGVSDRYGSTSELHIYPLEYGNDLIWDANLRPKTAYHSLRDSLLAQ